jgi:hypothetical protein
MGRATERTRARPSRAVLATQLTLLTLLTLSGGCAVHMPHMPRIGEHLMPPVVPYASAADTSTMSGRRWHRARGDAYDLYVQAPTIIPELDERMQETVRQFARHFGAVPRVAVLVFDAPADPTREFDFSAFQATHTQVLAFVRAPKRQRAGELGIDEGLLRARLAELFLAAYADSVVAARTGRWDGATGGHAVNRLPHWFAEAVISRVARPEAVEPGLRFLRANRLQLVPLQRLFGVARLGAPAWSEMADRKLPALALGADAAPAVPAAPALLAAESTVFGEFLVDRYGPTFLQAMADALLEGLPTERAFAGLPGVPADRAALERDWADWLARTADR